FGHAPFTLRKAVGDLVTELAFRLLLSLGALFVFARHDDRPGLCLGIRRNAHDVERENADQVRVELLRDHKAETEPLSAPLAAIEMNDDGLVAQDRTSFGQSPSVGVWAGT